MNYLWSCRYQQTHPDHMFYGWTSNLTIACTFELGFSIRPSLYDSRGQIYLIDGLDHPFINSDFYRKIQCPFLGGIIEWIIMWLLSLFAIILLCIFFLIPISFWWVWYQGWIYNFMYYSLFTLGHLLRSYHFV